MRKKVIKSLFIEYIDSTFLSIIFILVFGSLAANILKVTNLSSLFFKMQFITLTCWFVIILVRAFLKLRQHNYQRVNLICLVLCILIMCLGFFSVLIDLVLNNQNIIREFDYYSKLLIFCEIIAFLFAMYDGQFKKMPFVLLKILTLIFSFLVIVLFFTGFARTWSGLQQWRLLTMNFSNPNIAGLVLAVSILLLFFTFFTSRNLIIKILSVLCSVLLLLLLYFTSSRTGLFATIISLPLAYFLKGIIKKHPVTFNALLILFPLLFLSVYFIFFTIKGGGYYISPTISNGAKSSDTRYDVWYIALNNINLNPFIGNYYKVSGGSGVFHMHNTLIDLLSGFGITVTVFVILYLLLICKNSLLQSKYNLKKIFIPITFSLLVFLLGTFESFPFYSSNGLAFLALSFIALYKVPFYNFAFEEKTEHAKIICDVLLINNVYQFGSTGKIVEDCHKYYRKKGLKSYVIYGRNRHEENDEFAVCTESNLEVRACQILNKIFFTESIGYWYMTREIIYCIKYMKPKIVHIHGFNDDFVNFKLLLTFLSKTGIKVVCTLHSEHILLGNCGGYSFGCNNYSFGCQNCPLAKKNPIKRYFASQIKGLKESLFDLFDPENLVFTCVSPWLFNQFSKTKTAKRFSGFVVLNGSRLSLSTYDLNLNNKNKNDKQILYVTPSLKNPNKGFVYFTRLASEFEQANGYSFVAISMDECEETLPRNLSIIHNVTDVKTLQTFYEESVVTVICSKAETFSMPVIESLLSGTPVIGFKSGGPESIALKQYSKFVEYGDFESLFKLLKKMIELETDKTLIREEAKKIYSIDTMAENYLSVYGVLKDKPFSIEISQKASYCEIEI